MKIFDNIKFAFHLVRVGKSHTKLMAAKQLNDNDFESVLQNVTQFEKHLNKPTNERFSAFRDVADFVKKDVQFIKNFVNHNFEKSFSIALTMQGKQVEDAVWSRRIDSLMEIKARMPKDEYSNKYGEIETILKADINNHFSKKQTKAYNGVNMALAFGAYLDEKYDDMNFYLKKQITIYGLTEILNHEGNQQQAWYYNNVTPKYIEFLTNFFEKEMSSNNKVNTKMKPA